VFRGKINKKEFLMKHIILGLFLMVQNHQVDKNNTKGDINHTIQIENNTTIIQPPLFHHPLL